MQFDDIFDVYSQDNKYTRLKFITFFDNKEDFAIIISLLKQYKSIFEPEFKLWKIRNRHLDQIINTINSNFSNIAENNNYMITNIIDDIKLHIDNQDNENRQLEILNNIIKFCRTWAIDLQRKSICN